MPDDPKPDPALEAGQSGEAERPEWLPEKFDSPEALVKSQAEAERKITELGQNNSNLEAQLEDLYGRVQASESQGRPQAAYDPSTDPYLLAYENAMESGDYRAALAIQMGLNKQLVEQTTPQTPQDAPKDYDSWAFIAEQTAIQQVGPEEWAKYKQAVSNEAQSENFEGLSAQQAGQKLARLYKMVKADDVLDNQQTLAEQTAEADRQTKIQAQSVSGSSGRMPEPTRDEAAIEAIKKAAKEGSYESLIRGQ